MRNEFNLINFQDKIIKTILDGNRTNASFASWQKTLLKQGFTYEQAIEVIHDAFDMSYLERIVKTDNQIAELSR
jgi:hypothetical protein